MLAFLRVAVDPGLRGRDTQVSRGYFPGRSAQTPPAQCGGFAIPTSPNASRSIYDKHDLLAAIGIAAFPDANRPITGVCGCCLNRRPMIGGRALPKPGYVFRRYASRNFPAYVAGGEPNMPIFSDEEEAFKLRSDSLLTLHILQRSHRAVARWRRDPADRYRRAQQLGDVFADSRHQCADDGGQQWFVPVDWGNTSSTAQTLSTSKRAGSALGQTLRGRLSIGTVYRHSRDHGPAGWRRKPYNMTDEKSHKSRRSSKNKPLLRFCGRIPAIGQATASGESCFDGRTAHSTLRSGRRREIHESKGILTWCCGAVLCTDAPQPDSRSIDLCLIRRKRVNG
jgi:hypothetical protein